MTRPYASIKLKSPPVRLGREGSLVVPPKLTHCLFNKKFPVRCNREEKASVTLFRYVANWRLYPCSITGATELGYSFLFARSTRRSIRFLRFCLTYTSSIRLSGNRFETYSSSSAFLLCWSVF